MPKKIVNPLPPPPEDWTVSPAPVPWGLLIFIAVWAMILAGIAGAYLGKWEGICLR